MLSPTTILIKIYILNSRAKYHKLKYGTEMPQSEMQLPSASISAQDEYSPIPEVSADTEAPLSSITNVSWKQGRQLLRE